MASEGYAYTCTRAPLIRAGTRIVQPCLHESPEHPCYIIDHGHEVMNNRPQSTLTSSLVVTAARSDLTGLLPPDRDKEDVGVGEADAHHTEFDDQHSSWDSDGFWDVIARAHTLSLLVSISSESGKREANFSVHPLIRDWPQLREKAEQR